MNLPLTSMLGLGMISGSMLLILMSIERRASLLAFAGLYLGGGLLLVPLVTPQILISIVLTGMADATLLGTGNVRLQAPLPGRIITPRSFFRFFLGLIIWTLVYSFENKVAAWIPIPDSTLFAALFIICCSILSVALGNDIYLNFVNLLAIFFAFQLVYMLIEGSVLVFAFMTVINLLTALFGAILNLKPEEAQSEVGDQL